MARNQSPAPMVETAKETIMSDNPRPDELPADPGEPAAPTYAPSEAPMPGGDVDIPAPGPADAPPDTPGGLIG